MAGSAARFLDVPDLDAAGEVVAAVVAAAAGRAVAERGRASLVLAGGSTPRGVYERLADPTGAVLDWFRTHLFWGDERCVPPDDEASNYGLVRDILLDRIDIPAANVHRIPGELDPTAAAASFDVDLRRHFGAVAWPDFDLVLLGMGPDGHTASLFPGEALLDATAEWVGISDGRQGEPPVPRVSLTLGAINAARHVVVLVAGADKLAIVEQIRSGAPDAARYPAARVRPRGPLDWYLVGDSDR